MAVFLFRRDARLRSMRARTLIRDLTVLEEGLEKLVCVRNGSAGIFRDSHIVAFHWKVMGGQGYVGATTPACPAKCCCPCYLCFENKSSPFVEILRFHKQDGVMKEDAQVR
jgi:hypothetical protein